MGADAVVNRFVGRKGKVRALLALGPAELAQPLRKSSYA
jgi:hypothetical protein